MTTVSTVVAAHDADGWRVALVEQSGLWGLPTGVREGDESPDDAALRVAHAHVGLAVRLAGTSPTSSGSESPSVGREGPDGAMHLVFVALTDSLPEPSLHWVGPADVDDIALTADAREALLRFFPVLAALAAATNPIQASMVMARVLWSPVVSNPAGSNPSQVTDSVEHAVIVHLLLTEPGLGSRDDIDEVRALLRELNLAVKGGGLGDIDGNEFGGGTATVYLYGPDADALFAAVEPVIRRSPLRGSHAVLRYGSVGDPNVVERVVEF